MMMRVNRTGRRPDQSSYPQSCAGLQHSAPRAKNTLSSLGGIFGGNVMKKEFAILFVCAGLGVAVSPASASSLNYTPVSPTFGGNPLNGSFLLSTAQAQGRGVSSGQNSPDLSGLDAALSGLGSAGTANPIVVIGGSGTNVPTNP
jgi:curli production assembly/transport component CsgF